MCSSKKIKQKKNKKEFKTDNKLYKIIKIKLKAQKEILNFLKQGTKCKNKQKKRTNKKKKL